MANEAAINIKEKGLLSNLSRVSKPQKYTDQL